MIRQRMSRLSTVLLVLAVCVCLSCKKPTPNTVIIVEKSAEATIHTDISAQDSEQAKHMWVAGQIFLFRADETVNGQNGKSGEAYQLDKNLKLQKIGAFDPKESDINLVADWQWWPRLTPDQVKKMRQGRN